MERNLFKYSVPLASKGLLAAPPLMDLIEGSTLAGALMDAIREPLLVLDGDLHVVTANRSFYLEFKLERQDVQDRSVYALGDGQWNIPELRLLLENVAPQHAVMDACEVEQDFSGIGRRTMTINARKLFCADTLRPAILLLIEDTTERRARECEMKALLQEKDVLLQEMQHRIANSLQIIASILLIKARTVRSEETRLHLQDAHQRVMSIAAMQQQLQVSEPGTTIEPRSLSIPAVRDARGLDDRRPPTDFLEGACPRRRQVVGAGGQHRPDCYRARHQCVQACVSGQPERRHRDCGLRSGRCELEADCVRQRCRSVGGPAVSFKIRSRHNHCRSAGQAA
jgi:hypothetical protein